MAESTDQIILVVDDVAFMRRLLVGILTKLGYATIEASSGEEAVRAIKKQAPTLIFMDIVMPEVDGIALCKWVRQNEATRDTPVIMCTAHQDRKSIEAAIRAGATDLILKPVDGQKVRKRLDKHLGTPKTAP